MGRFPNMMRSLSPLRLLAAGAVVAAGALGSFAPSARAATPTCPTLNGTALTQTSTVSPPGGNTFIVCNAKVPSFDGTPLDVDVALPTVPYIPGGSSTPQTPPLMVFMHGWGNSKADWEATTLAGDGTLQYDWNDAWFASQGWVVLSYNARGFDTSCGKDPAAHYSYATDPACSGKESWTHLADRRWEVHDAQFLAGTIVDAGLVNPQQIVASGESYGGGQSWELALSQDEVVSSTSTSPQTPTLTPWVSPVNHIPMHLVAAIPHYPWTDLQDALLPNGRASDGFHGAPPDGSHGSPYGVEKQSYVDGLYALGEATAQYAPPKVDPTADLTSWFEGVSAGEPYGANPDAVTAAQQVGGIYRSPFAMAIPGPRHQVPVFVIQGFTDPLFNALQALYMINRLDAKYPNYPVWSFFGDVGHSYADNPDDVWVEAHNEANAWLDSILSGHGPTQPRVTAVATHCVSGQSLLHTETESNFKYLVDSAIVRDSSTAQHIVSSNAVTPEGAQTDPIANKGCRTMASSQSDPNEASYTFAVPSRSAIAGGPVVKVNVTVDGSSAELDARLWDVDSSGSQTLISRTPYRIEDGTSGTKTMTLTFELWPNFWQMQCGHSIKLELTQDDSPTWRPDNEPSSITVNTMQLTLPVDGGSHC